MAIWITKPVPEGCWLWRLSTTMAGYGQFHPLNKGESPTMLLAHRVAYELWVGPIPKGRVIHHKCGNRSCVNPTHLECTGQRENVKAYQDLRATCKEGHPLDGVNNKGHRFCKACDRARGRAVKLSQKALLDKAMREG